MVTQTPPRWNTVSAVRSHLSPLCFLSCWSVRESELTLDCRSNPLTDILDDQEIGLRQDLWSHQLLPGEMRCLLSDCTCLLYVVAAVDSCVPQRADTGPRAETAHCVFLSPIPLSLQKNQVKAKKWRNA